MLRSQTNIQISRYLHFLINFSHFLIRSLKVNWVRAVNRQPGLPRGMTRRAPSHWTPPRTTLSQRSQGPQRSTKAPNQCAKARKTSKIRAFFAIPGHARKLSTTRKSSQGIESDQRMHLWMSHDLRKAEKLLRSETNTQILRNLHFYGPIARL